MGSGTVGNSIRNEGANSAPPARVRSPSRQQRGFKRRFDQRDRRSAGHAAICACIGNRRRAGSTGRRGGSGRSAGSGACGGGGAGRGACHGGGSGRSASSGACRGDGAGGGNRTCRGAVNCYDHGRSGSGCAGISASNDRRDSSTGRRDRATDDARAGAGGERRARSAGFRGEPRRAIAAPQRRQRLPRRQRRPRRRPAPAPSSRQIRRNKAVRSGGCNSATARRRSI